MNNEGRLALLLKRTQRQGECLLWTGATGHKGYGRTKWRGKEYRAHRLAWELVRGPIPDGLMLDHTCWNPACVNVEHLRLATNQQNQMYRSGPNRGRKHDLPRGVYFLGGGGKPYSAKIMKDRKLRNLGDFATVEEAYTVRRRAELELFGAYAGA